MNRLFSYLSMSLAATTLLATAGCVKEKDVVCYSGLMMHYHYELNPERANLFGRDVDKLTILVFEYSSERFHRMFVVDNPARLTDDNLIHLDVPDGEWKVVTWGGDMSSFDMGLLDANGDVAPHDYTSNRNSTLAQHRVWLKDFTLTSDGSKLVTSDISPLYYGYIDHAVAQTNPWPTPHTEVQMMRNTNTLSISLTGLPPDTAPPSRAHEDNLTIHADMVNGRCRGDNEICLDALNVHYAQTHAISSSATTLGVDLTVMRLFDHDRESVITVSGEMLAHHGYTGGEIVIPIVPTIMENPLYGSQEELDRENFYQFGLHFSADMSLTVTLNGWVVKYVTVEPV
jgi:hypothetical protein